MRETKLDNSSDIAATLTQFTQPPIKLRALLFDFDGLILETEYPYYASWSEVYESYGLSLELNDWAALIGKGATVLARTPYEDIETRLGRSLDHDAIRAQRRAAFDRLMAQETTLPGVEALIGEAKRLGILLGVASSSPRSWVASYLERLGLYNSFGAICCGDEVERTKPAPDVYLALLRTVGIGAEEAVALEDSAHGAAAAKDAGLFCVFVLNRITRHIPPAAFDLHVTSLEDVSVADLAQALASSHTVRSS